MSVKFGDSNIGAEIGTPSLNASITKPSINVNFNAPSLGASGGNTILRELVNPQFFIGTVTTLEPGEDVYCYLTGTKDEPILNFGIPMGFPGVDGKDGKDGVDGKDGADGTDGVSPEVTISTITGGHSVTITDADHPTGQTFNVMDGVDGQDGQDGQDGVGVPASGTTGQLLAKKSNTDYDTEWVNPPQGTVTDVTVNGSSVVSQGVAAVTVPEPAPSDGATPSSDTKYGSVGTSTQYARKDHRHTSNFPTTGTPADLGTAANGTSAAYAHADHVHNSVTKGFTVTLASASWSSKAQTVSNANFIASGYAYVVSPASGSFTDYAEAQIYADDVSTDGQMTFHCADAPSSNLTVNIVRVVAT